MKTVEQHKTKDSFYELLKNIIEEIVDERLSNLNQQDSQQKPFMSLEEASLYLGLSKNTLYAYNCKGVIPFKKVGNKTIYYKIEDLDNFILGSSKQSKSKAERQTEFYTANSIKSMTKKTSRIE